MAIAAQPTVLDRLKERLVVALGKGQDKRVKSTENLRFDLKKELLKLVSGV